MSDEKKDQTINTTTYHLDIAAIKTDPKLLFTPFRQKNHGDEYFEHIAHALLEWARTDPNALKITQFCAAYHIPRKQLYAWAKKKKFLREAMDEARGIIGDRREIGAARGILKEGIITKSMTMYDPEWKEDAKFKSKLAREDQSEMVHSIVLKDLSRGKTERFKVK